MQKILKELFLQHDMEILQKKTDPAILQRIAANEGMLKKKFNKWQHVRLLDILDDKDLLASHRAYDHFVSGVRYGVMFMIEALNTADE